MRDAAPGTILFVYPLCCNETTIYFWKWSLRCLVLCFCERCFKHTELVISATEQGFDGIILVCFVILRTCNNILKSLKRLHNYHYGLNVTCMLQLEFSYKALPALCTVLFHRKLSFSSLFQFPPQLEDEALKHIGAYCPELVTLNLQTCSVSTLMMNVK